MFWFDWLTLGIILAVAVIMAAGAGRAGGFGQALFQALLLCLAATSSVNLYEPLALALHVQRSVALIGLFVVLGTAAWFLGRLLHSLTGWSFGSFDAPLGFLFGVIAGWAIAHMVLRMIIESQGYAGPVAQNLSKAPVAAEVYWFRTWNKLMELLFNARSGSREMWDVDKHGVR
jgi:hypothetical protein